MKTQNYKLTHLLTAVAGLALLMFGTGAFFQYENIQKLTGSGTVKTYSPVLDFPAGTLVGGSAPTTAAAIGVSVQAYDADLSTWATVTPSANGKSMVSAADYSAMRTALSLRPGTDVQAYDANLTTWAGVAPSANGQSLVAAANYAAMSTLLQTTVGIYSQAYDADLTTWAGVTPSADGQSLVSAANYAAMRGLLDLEPGTDYLAVPASSAWGDVLFRGETGWVRLPAGTSGRYLKTLGVGADPAWDVPTGTGAGDMSGPASSVLNQVARFADITGKLAQASSVYIADVGTLTLPGGQAVQTDIVSEATAAAGVTVDGVLFKDSAVSGLITVTPHASTGNITATECKGGTATNTGAGGAVVLSLPAAVVGYSVVVFLTVAQDVDIDPDGTDQIMSLTNAAGDKISSDAAIGSYVVLVCLDSGKWYSFGYAGTWSDAN